MRESHLSHRKSTAENAIAVSATQHDLEKADEATAATMSIGPVMDLPRTFRTEIVDDLWKYRSSLALNQYAEILTQTVRTRVRRQWAL